MSGVSHQQALYPCLLYTSNIIFAWAHKDTIASTPDTTFSVNMFCRGEMANHVGPTGEQMTPEVFNYYIGNVTAEAVPAYHRVKYKNVYRNTDMVLYHGHGGVKLAMVLEPGADPGDLELGFEGHDSLKIDVNGWLRIYQRGRWIILREAMAYQINAQGQQITVDVYKRQHSWCPADACSGGSNPR